MYKSKFAQTAALIYYFYGFPPHFYEHEFSNRDSPEIARRVAEVLPSISIDVEEIQRGFDWLYAW